MNKAPLRFLLLAALAIVPTSLALESVAFAQGKKKPDAKKEDVEDLGGDDTPPPPPDKGGDKGGKSAGGGALAAICEINKEACEIDKLIEQYKKKDLLDSQVYAVQQIYALRRGRVELSPYWAASLNDQFVSHPGPGLALNYYVTNVLAIGVNFNFYQKLNSEAEFNKLVRQSTRLAIPINEYQFGANLNFTYVPIYGKFAGFGDFIFHWDTYVVGGIGVLSTRPVAVIDPEFRGFKFKPKVAFNAGIGVRVFFNRWLSAFLEVRDYIYNEELENLSISKAAQADSSTWIDQSRITNAVQAQFGFSVFLPTGFTYKLAK